MYCRWFGNLFWSKPSFCHFEKPVNSTHAWKTESNHHLPLVCLLMFTVVSSSPTLHLPTTWAHYISHTYHQSRFWFAPKIQIGFSINLMSNKIIKQSKMRQTCRQPTYIFIPFSQFCTGKCGFNKTSRFSGS